MAKELLSPLEPRIYRAEAPANANGVVYYFGSELTVQEAVAHRKSGGNVVVRPAVKAKAPGKSGKSA